MSRLSLVILSFIISIPVFAWTPRYTPSDDLKKAAESINVMEYLEDIRELADDKYEGRGPGTRGDELAREWITEKFKAIGLEPGASGDEWQQPFGIVGITSSPTTDLVLSAAHSDDLALEQKKDFVAVCWRKQSRCSIDQAELVFVGYGIIAEKFNWNDYKDVDVRDKVVVLLNHNPPSFAGGTRLIYGRWTYKLEEAARKGAAGAIVIHTEPSAGYPWEVIRDALPQERSSLAKSDAIEPVELHAWVTGDTAYELFEYAGKDLDQLRQQAQEPIFKPIPLDVDISIELENQIRDGITSANVIGVLPGSHPKLKNEYVIFSGHHDHLGIKTNAEIGEDNIYNGALDNASGVAALFALAKSYANLPTHARPKRSIMFAAVGGEESGHLGSIHMLENPPVHTALMTANINLDMLLNIFGKTADIIFIGTGRTSLDYVTNKVAGYQNRFVKPDTNPNAGLYYRSDVYSFAKAGIPAISFNAGDDVIGQPYGWGKEQKARWRKEVYHKVSDEYRITWKKDGMLIDLKYFFYLGHEVALMNPGPTWDPSDEFSKAREKALADFSRKQRNL